MINDDLYNAKEHIPSYLKSPSKLFFCIYWIIEEIIIE